jgi:RNA polymerase sigma-70 factor (ECF subfamily)
MGTRAVEPALKPLDDEILANKVAEDFEAFAELYRRHMCSVYRFIRPQVRDEATAEDLTAHTFFKAWSSASTFRAEGAYQAWLFKIAQNSVTTWHAKDGRAVVLERVPDSLDPTPSPASQVIVGEERSQVWETISQLPPAQREAVTLRYLLDLSVGEVARATRRSRGAVRVLLHRARFNLRKALERRRGGDGS